MKSKKVKVPPRFELGSLDSKSRVLTITPWDRYMLMKECENFKNLLLFLNWRKSLKEYFSLSLTGNESYKILVRK